MSSNSAAPRVLAGQVAIVTGAGRGFGRAIAGRLAAEGAAVALTARSGAQLAEAVAARPDDVEAALTAYEQALFPRAAADATEAARDFDLCFGENTPRSLIDLLTGVA
jgi:NAD(P)-dependent dehydrogenase (short-subunit alcohol dehydrogenase family)